MGCHRQTNANVASLGAGASINERLAREHFCGRLRPWMEESAESSQLCPHAVRCVARRGVPIELPTIRLSAQLYSSIMIHDPLSLHTEGLLQDLDHPLGRQIRNSTNLQTSMLENACMFYY